jgi:hypothetical protein
MNRFLAEAAAVFNAVAALITVALCTLIGAYVWPIAVPYYAASVGLGVRQSPDQLQAQGIIWGLIAGIIVAVMAHGFLALLIAMHKELKAIRTALQRRS